jgi:hypothetical protein
MSTLINYKGFEIPQPTPANLGGEALANNFKRLGDLLSVTSATFYVDNTRTDVFEPDGSVLHPFLTIQDAIDAALALADAPGTSSINTAIAIGPGIYREVLTVALPARTFRLSMRGAGSGPGNSTLTGPIEFLLSDATSPSTMISIANIDFATNTVTTGSPDTAFKITDAEHAGYTLFLLDSVQCYADHTTDYAMHVTDAGGTGQLIIQCNGHTLIKSEEGTSSGSDAVTALRMERGLLTGLGTGFYSLRAPAVILSGTAGLQLVASQATVLLGTAGAADVDCIQAQDHANIRIQESLFTPAGNGQVLVHSGSFDGSNGIVALNDLGAVLGAGSGGIYMPAGALLLAGQMTSETGQPLPVTVASPALHLYIQHDVNVAFTAANPSDWATAAPVTVSDAINRLAAAVVALQGGPIS